MANSRNYEEYRGQVLDELGIEYVTEDITDFRRWRLKVLQGLADLITTGDMTVPVAKWLSEHPEITTSLQDGEVTTAKLADGSVDTDKIVSGAIEEDKIANGAVTIDKLGEDVGRALEEPYQKYISNTYPDQNEHELYKDMVRRNLVSFLVRNNFSSCFKTGTAINDDEDGYKTVFKYRIGSCFMGLYGAGTFDYDDVETVDNVDYKVAYFDCTNFVSLITRGRSFENSPYAYAFSHPDATIDDLYSLGLEDPDPNKNYTFDALNNVKTDNFARIMNGSGNTLQLIQRLPRNTSVDEAHQTVDEKVVDNLETGDLIFIGKEADDVTNFKGIYHVGMYVRNLTELDALATDHGITFKPKDTGDTKYGYVVEVWSVGSTSYQDKLIIHTLDYWLTTRYSGDVQYVYMCKGYANSMNSNKQYSLVTGMYRLYGDIKFVDTATYSDGRFPQSDLRLSLPSGFSFVGGRPYQLKNIDIDTMNTAKYNGVWMPYNSTDLNSLSGSIPLSNVFFTLIVFGADTSGKSAKQIMVFSSKDMPSDNIIYIRQTGASGNVFGAWKKISITNLETNTQ